MSTAPDLSSSFQLPNRHSRPKAGTDLGGLGSCHLPSPSSGSALIPQPRPGSSAADAPHPLPGTCRKHLDFLTNLLAGRACHRGPVPSAPRAERWARSGHAAHSLVFMLLVTVFYTCPQALNECSHAEASVPLPRPRPAQSQFPQRSAVLLR